MDFCNDCGHELNGDGKCEWCDDSPLLNAPLGPTRLELETQLAAVKKESEHISDCNRNLTEENTYLLTQLTAAQERLALARGLLFKITHNEVCLCKVDSENCYIEQAKDFLGNAPEEKSGGR